jgi:hypothetical protein
VAALQRQHVAVARHLAEDRAVQLIDQLLVVAEVADRPDRLGAEEEAHAHRAGGQRVGG